jgi:hypothetical protein
MAEELGRPRYPLPETSACIAFDLDIWSPLIGSLHWPLECHGRRSHRLCLLRHFFPPWRTTGSLYRAGKSDSHQRGSVACICIRQRVRSRRYRVHVRLLSHIVDGFDTHLSRCYERTTRIVRQLFLGKLPLRASYEESTLN